MAAIGELTPYFSFGIIGDPQYADKVCLETRTSGHRLASYSPIIYRPCQPDRCQLRLMCFITSPCRRMAMLKAVFKDTGTFQTSCGKPSGSLPRTPRHFAVYWCSVISSTEGLTRWENSESTAHHGMDAVTQASHGTS